jgi:hypothetical protein
MNCSAIISVPEYMREARRLIERLEQQRLMLQKSLQRIHACADAGIEIPTILVTFQDNMHTDHMGCMRKLNEEFQTVLGFVQAGDDPVLVEKEFFDFFGLCADKMSMITNGLFSRTITTVLPDNKIAEIMCRQTACEMNFVLATMFQQHAAAGACPGKKLAADCFVLMSKDQLDRLPPVSGEPKYITLES